MTARTFSIEAQPDGGAKLTLNYKEAGQSGLQRMSCAVSQDDLLQLVLYAEALSLRRHYGHPVASEVSADGLTLRYDPDSPELHVERRSGYTTQNATIPVRDFLSRMAEMTDICIAVGEASRHGPCLKALLDECARLSGLGVIAEPDAADQALHQIQEIVFLLLVQDASTRGSELARNLRKKASRDQALEMVNATLCALVAELLLPCLGLGDTRKQ
ncbi:hypothetical protein [Celeribacter halophilus]|uniref:hypothetical protein n=1 Tax=Celeribacter halophilus TaxID=576117 RepID=UPI003A929A1E